MCKLARHAVRIATVLLLGGFLGATLVRLAPGFGVDEEELDSRLNKESIQALRRAHSTDENVAEVLRSLFEPALPWRSGNLAVSAPTSPAASGGAVSRDDEVDWPGLGLRWSAGLALAMIAVMSRSMVCRFRQQDFGGQHTALRTRGGAGASVRNRPGAGPPGSRVDILSQDLPATPAICWQRAHRFRTC